MISHNQRGAAKSPGDLACAAVLEGSEASLQTLGGWPHLGAICAFESNQEQHHPIALASKCCCITVETRKVVACLHRRRRGNNLQPLETILREDGQPGGSSVTSVKADSGTVRKLLLRTFAASPRLWHVRLTARLFAVPKFGKKAPKLTRKGSPRARPRGLPPPRPLAQPGFIPPTSPPRAGRRLRPPVWGQGH